MIRKGSQVMQKNKSVESDMLSGLGNTFVDGGFVAVDKEQGMERSR